MRIKRKPSSRTRCSCATASTAKANRTWYSLLNFGDEREKECALRGLIESPNGLVIKRDDGEVAKLFPLSKLFLSVKNSTKYKIFVILKIFFDFFRRNWQERGRG